MKFVYLFIAKHMGAGNLCRAAGTGVPVPMCVTQVLKSYKSVFEKFLTIILVLLAAGPVYCEKDPRPNESVSVAEFFGDLTGKSVTAPAAVPAWSVGDERVFHVLDIAAGSMTDCIARVFLGTDHIVFWYDTEEVQEIPDHLVTGLSGFDMNTLPMLREVFGTESNPGVDNDPRFHVLFTGKIGDAYNGYFSAEDSADPLIRPTSNGMELVFLNTRLLTQGTNAVIDTLAHEYQHMIHFNYDQNEPSFINEGLSCLAEYLALGTFRDAFIHNYLGDTGRSLIWWPDSGTNVPYYGSAFLFSVYLYDRFGEDVIRALVCEAENGLNGLDRALANLNVPYSADEVFQQWTAALLGKLQQQTVPGWGYRAYSFPQEGVYRDIRQLDRGTRETHEVSQYGVRFYSGGCEGPCRITVEGSAESPVTALPIPGGESAWWSGAVNNSMSLLSRDFDLRSAVGPIAFSYDIGFDIEQNYDFYYLLLRDQEGTVTRLMPSTAVFDDPVQIGRGGGTTGKSAGVIHEVIDLTPWIGQQIRLSFVYLTDTAKVGDGVVLDNFRIDAIGYSDDAEAGDGGWEAEGFSRIGSAIPQRFSLVVLHPREYGTADAAFYSFTGGEPFTAECPEGNCSFAVSAVERDIRSRAAFSVQIEPVTE